MIRLLTLACPFLVAADAAALDQAPSHELQQGGSILLKDVRGRIDHMAIDREGHRLFVAALGNGSVEVIDLASGKQSGSIPGLKEPQGVAYVPSTGQVIVACGGDGTCRAFDGATLKQVASVDAGSDPDNVRVDDGRACVYVGFDPGIAVLEISGLKKRRDIRLSGHAESFQLEAGGPRMFVNVPDSKQIQVVDRDTDTVVGTWQVSDAKRNYPMALDSDGRRLFVVCRDPARVLMLDTTSGQILTSVECVGDADDVFFDATLKILFVSGGAGSLDVFGVNEADNLKRTQRVQTASGARTCLYDAPSHSLYLAIPQRGEQSAEIRVFTVASPH